MKAIAITACIVVLQILVMATFLCLGYLLAGCAAPTSEMPPATLKCPSGQILLHGAAGPHCAIPDDMVNTTPGCHPVVCSVLESWAMYGHAANADAIGWCAAACDAYCQDDVDGETYSLAQAKASDPTFRCEY